MAGLEHRERQVGFWVVSYIPFCCLVGKRELLFFRKSPC